MSDEDEVCWQCDWSPHPGVERDERTPGYCVQCNFFFDRYGMRVSEPWRTCSVHSDLRASCPHSRTLRD